MDTETEQTMEQAQDPWDPFFDLGRYYAWDMVPAETEPCPCCNLNPCECP